MPKLKLEHRDCCMRAPRGSRSGRMHGDTTFRAQVVRLERTSKGYRSALYVLLCLVGAQALALVVYGPVAFTQ